MKRNSLKTVALFPTLIHHQALTTRAATAALNRRLRSDIEAMMKIDREGWAWSKRNYVGGYTSYSSIANVHLRFAPFMDLKARIDRKVRDYARALNWDLGERELTMTTCWVNVMPGLVHHSLHLHPRAVVSGTYYVATPPGSGELKFEDPRLGLFMNAPARKAAAPAACQPFYTLKPKAGDLALWESWLRHEVTANRGSQLRISVSFNYE